MGLLLLAALNVWWAWNLERPVYRHRWGHMISFVFGWLIGELAPFVVAAQAVLLILVLAGRDLHGALDWVALVALLLAWGAMLRHYVAGDDAAEVMEQALQDALGRDYREHIPPRFSARFPLSVSARTLLHPFRLDLPEVVRVRDIAYAQAEGQELRLDVYHHRDRPSGAPVLLQIHGGGWTEKMGSKNEQARPLMNHMASRGWVCVSVDYRLSPAATFPAHIIDCKRALAWVRENIATWGGDAEFVVVTGGSAGGHLSALLALSANDPAYQPGFEESDTAVAGCVPFYGVYDFGERLGLRPNAVLAEALESYIVKATYRDAPELYDRGSPLLRVHEEAPAFLVIHGDKDSLCTVEEARVFAARLREVSGRPVALALIPGAQHGFDLFRSLRSELVMHGVERFLVHLHARYLGRSA